VSGTHFFPDVNPENLGHKALAVNLSDMAAMGALPYWAMLAVTLPHVDHAWLAAFAKGFFDLAQEYNVSLVGGDTTRGPSLVMTVTIMGEVPAGAALRRSGARVGNDVFIWSGNHVGHHASVGDHCYIAGNVVISGNTVVEPYCFLGVSSTVGHEVTVGAESFIGAGSLVTKNVAPRSVYVTPDTPKFRLDSAAFLRLTKMK